jgi:hypothetical protein
VIFRQIISSKLYIFYCKMWKRPCDVRFLEKTTIFGRHFTTGNFWITIQLFVNKFSLQTFEHFCYQIAKKKNNSNLNTFSMLWCFIFLKLRQFLWHPLRRVQVQVTNKLCPPLLYIAVWGFWVSSRGDSCSWMVGAFVWEEWSYGTAAAAEIISFLYRCCML